MQELCDEIRNGECSLMQDCSGDFTANKLVRVVDVVLLRLRIKGSKTKEVLSVSVYIFGVGLEHFGAAQSCECRCARGAA